MGTNKALLEVGGGGMLGRTADLLRPLVGRSVHRGRRRGRLRGARPAGRPRRPPRPRRRSAGFTRRCGTRRTRWSSASPATCRTSARGVLELLLAPPRPGDDALLPRIGGRPGAAAGRLRPHAPAGHRAGDRRRPPQGHGRPRGAAGALPRGGGARRRDPGCAASSTSTRRKSSPRPAPPRQGPDRDARRTRGRARAPPASGATACCSAAEVPVVREMPGHPAAQRPRDHHAARLGRRPGLSGRRASSRRRGSSPAARTSSRSGSTRRGRRWTWRRPGSTRSRRSCSSGAPSPPAAARGRPSRTRSTRSRPGRRPPARGSAPAQIRALMHGLLRGSELYREAGGVHSAALCDRRGDRDLPRRHRAAQRRRQDPRRVLPAGDPGRGQDPAHHRPDLLGDPRQGRQARRGHPRVALEPDRPGARAGRAHRHHGGRPGPGRRPHGLHRAKNG